MKKISVAVLLSLLGLPAFAQQLTQEGVQRTGNAATKDGAPEVELYEERGMQTSLNISLPDVRKSVVDRVWKNYTRSQLGSTAKYNRKTREFVAAQAKAPAIASGPVNLMSRSSQMGADVHFTLVVDAQSSFLNTGLTPRRASNAQSLLEDFALEVRREKIRMQVEEEEKNLKRMESSLQQLKNANVRYHREIEMAQQRIARANENIQQNEKDQVTAADQIKAQAKLLEAVKKQLSQL